MPTVRLTVITLGVADMRRSIAFYAALGFSRKFRATGEEVAFFDTGGSVLALYPSDRLAGEAESVARPRPPAFRGMTLAWNCNSREEVDDALAHAVSCGGTALKVAHSTSYGGYGGYFADPDGHVWEVVTAPGLKVTADGRLTLPD